MWQRLKPIIFLICYGTTKSHTLIQSTSFAATCETLSFVGIYDPAAAPVRNLGFPQPLERTADPSTPLRSGRDDKVGRIVRSKGS